eukprot:TRINITY_DN3028_c0_g1_i1.p2 TRINITY_DN3028_c0_g1~~TRINITY_DN3028_c0_g1_i1.p2  ORF type:complete len:233 (-),score=-15.97 TRINITY_DN3028_c0_g1_i1:33-731(-)
MGPALWCFHSETPPCGAGVSPASTMSPDLVVRASRLLPRQLGVPEPPPLSFLLGTLPHQPQPESEQQSTRDQRRGPEQRPAPSRMVAREPHPLAGRGAPRRAARQLQTPPKRKRGVVDRAADPMARARGQVTGRYPAGDAQVPGPQAVVEVPHHVRVSRVQVAQRLVSLARHEQHVAMHGLATSGTVRGRDQAKPQRRPDAAPAHAAVGVSARSRVAARPGNDGRAGEGVAP